MADSIISLSTHGVVVWPLCPVWLFVTPWPVARQAPLSMQFPRQEHWSWLPVPSPRDLPNPGIEPESPALQRNSLPLTTSGAKERVDKYLRHKHLNCCRWGPNPCWPPPEQSYVKAGVYTYGSLWWGWCSLRDDPSTVCVREVLLSLINLGLPWWLRR